MRKRGCYTLRATLYNRLTSTEPSATFRLICTEPYTTRVLILSCLTSILKIALAAVMHVMKRSTKESTFPSKPMKFFCRNFLTCEQNGFFARISSDSMRRLHDGSHNHTAKPVLLLMIDCPETIKQGEQLQSIITNDVKPQYFSLIATNSASRPAHSHSIRRRARLLLHWAL